MAVSINTIYQRVLTLANKEQRGYITPQEFNLFANQAQMDIFEQYFYDIKQFNRASGNDTEFSDPLSILNEKISIFEVERGSNWTSTNLGTNMILPEEIYRLGTVREGNDPVEILTTKEFNEARISYLTSPTKNRPIGCLVGRELKINQGYNTAHINASTHSINISYIRKPLHVSWGYVVVNNKAMYDPSNTVDFELHSSEEGELTGRILAFAGVAIKQPSIVEMASMMEQGRAMNEKQ
jgi:hypothetical protein